MPSVVTLWQHKHSNRNTAANFMLFVLTYTKISIYILSCQALCFLLKYSVETNHEREIFMKPNTTKLHHELRKIAGLQALTFVRHYLLFATAFCMLSFFSQSYNVYYMYVFFFTLLAPFFMEQIPQKQTSVQQPKLFPVLKKEYQYSSLRYQCLLWTFWIDNLLLAVWVIKASITLPDTLFHHVPLFLLVSNILFYLLFFYYYQFKFHYQLINNRW